MSCNSAFTCAAQVASSNFACGTQSTYVQDQVCSDINIPLTTAEIITVIYSSNLNPSRLYVSGTVAITGAPVDRLITVNFRLGGPTGTVIESDEVLPGTSLAFNKTGFDTIELVIGAGAAISPNVTGQLCITARYPVS